MKAGLLPVKAAAAYIDLSPGTLRRLARTGEIPYYCYGSQTSPWKVSKADLDTFLQSHRIDNSAEVGCEPLPGTSFESVTPVPFEADGNDSQPSPIPMNEGRGQ